MAMTKMKDTVRGVGDVMTGDVITLSPADPVVRAHEFLVGAGLHALPVVDPTGKPAGIVTLADITEAAMAEPVASFMIEPVVTIDVAASISEAAELMRAEYIHHLVVTEGELIVGILSSYDLLVMLVDEP